MYLNMFIFTTDERLCEHELIDYIMSCNYSLGLKNFQINLIYSIFTYVYIYNRSRVITTQANMLHY
jgi:hypothetical protein